VSQPHDDRQDDLFGPSLDKIINLRHPLVRVAAEIDWAFLAASVRSVGSGRGSHHCRRGWWPDDNVQNLSHFQGLPPVGTVLSGKSIAL
jgi:hypothetical protein